VGSRLASLRDQTQIARPSGVSDPELLNEIAQTGALAHGTDPGSRTRASCHCSDLVAGPTSVIAPFTDGRQVHGPLWRPITAIRGAETNDGNPAPQKHRRRNPTNGTPLRNLHRPPGPLLTTRSHTRSVSRQARRMSSSRFFGQLKMTLSQSSPPKSCPWSRNATFQLSFFSDAGPTKGPSPSSASNAGSALRFFDKAAGQQPRHADRRPTSNGQLSSSHSGGATPLESCPPSGPLPFPGSGPLKLLKEP